MKDFLLQTMVELGGAIFKGRLAAFRDKHGKLTEELVLFNSPTTKTTLALPISQISATAVRRRVKESDAEFEAFAEKACTFVLREFSGSVRRTLVGGKWIFLTEEVR